MYVIALVTFLRGLVLSVWTERAEDVKTKIIKKWEFGIKEKVYFFWLMRENLHLKDAAAYKLLGNFMEREVKEIDEVDQGGWPNGISGTPLLNEKRKMASGALC